MAKQVIFDKKNVLVVGGAGFIGSHLCDKLVETCKVICIDNFSTGNERNIDHLLADPNFRFIKHDLIEQLVLEDLQELDDFKVEFQGIQEIYNLACPMSILNFDDNKVANLTANSLLVKNVLDLALKYQAKILHFSSSVVYGGEIDDDRKIAENERGIVDHLSSRASYDEGKRFAETMVMTYRDYFDIDAKIIRPFRIYGPRMPLDDGQMIPDFITHALDNEDLTIYGDENFASSFCYVSDCVSAAIKMMESDQAGPINIGSDLRVKLHDVAKQITKLLGSTSSINYTDKLMFMTPLALPDITKARESLDWMPVVILDNGLEKTINDLRASKGVKTIHHYVKG
ncbi:MAG: NAD-dependent epimerase/dehydratase family protein [bacterium]